MPAFPMAAGAAESHDVLLKVDAVNASRHLLHFFVWSPCPLVGFPIYGKCSFSE